jgi:predicted Fe-Mo cluster-binding NifX family protein
MKICIPVTQDIGIKSPVSEHFGSAPIFLIVDTTTHACRAIPNANEPHAHGMCNPLSKLAGEKVDGIVVAGIGLGALQKFNAAGVRVFISKQVTVEDSVRALAAGSLPEATPGTACSHHGGGCGHSHP